ncbi:antitoxin VbhA family protein [Gallibacterium anatis]|uniref:antitoxin VbhA family protein n=1 Tax=Gallibacterium anatis TaxID=750 RepID=UPI0039FD7EC5
MISETEKKSRREAVEYAKASVELEGIFLEPELLDIADKYIQGILTREEFTQEYIRAVRAGLNMSKLSLQ